MSGAARAPRIRITQNTLSLGVRDLTLTGSGWTLTEDGPGRATLELTGGGGGVTSHPALTDLSWTASGHTGTATRLAGFDGSGAASVYSVSTPLSLSGGALTIDLSAYLTTAAAAATYQPLDSDLTALAGLGNGLPHRSSGAWAALSISSPLQVSGGALSILTASGSQAGALSSSDWLIFNNKVDTGRTISTTSPLGGGGDLSANRTLTLSYSAPLVMSGGNLTVQGGTSAQKGAVQLAPDGASTAGQVVAADDSRLRGLGGIAVATGELVYGSGRDGSLTLDGSAVAGMTLTSTTYKLDRHIEAENLTINAGYTLDPNGWVIRVRSLLTLGNGALITNDGTNASGGTAGPGAAPATNPTAASAPFYGGANGAPGRTTTGTGTASTTPGGIKVGGSGFAAQTAPSGGGTTQNTNVSANDVGTPWFRYNGSPDILLILGQRLKNGTAENYATGGNGGASGAWSHTSGGVGTSGSGGGGGGVLVLAARKLSVSGSGHRFSANGGNASNATATAGTNMATGGGAGGAGGFVAIKIGQVVSGTLPPAEAKGGAGGNGAEFNRTTNFGNGGNGGNGGTVFYSVETYTGSAPANTVAGGAAGSGSANGSAGTAGATGNLYYNGALT